LRSQDLIFDALTLPIHDGQEEYRTAGMETLEAVRRIKIELPECRDDAGRLEHQLRAECVCAARVDSVFLKEGGGPED